MAKRARSKQFLADSSVGDILMSSSEYVPDYSSLKIPVPPIRAVPLLQERLNALQWIRDEELPPDNEAWKKSIRPLLIKLYGPDSSIIDEVINPACGLSVVEQDLSTDDSRWNYWSKQVAKQFEVLTRLVAEQNAGLLVQDGKKGEEGPANNDSIVLRIEGHIFFWLDTVLKLRPMPRKLLRRLCIRPQIHIKRSDLMSDLDMNPNSEKSFKTHLSEIRKAIKTATRQLSKKNKKIAFKLATPLIETRQQGSKKNADIILNLRKNNIFLAD